MNKNIWKLGFTLTEILLAVVIVGIIATLVLPSVITKYHNSSFEKLAQRMLSSIQESIDSLPVTENKDFFETMMYAESETGINYENTSGAFLKKYMRLSRYCGTSEAGKKECFAANYYKYEDEDKKTYTPEYKGACASLKNGASICLTPQIGSSTCPTALVDLNGKKGPNVLGIDLRELDLSCKTKVAFNRDSHDVTVDYSNIEDDTVVEPPPPPPSACSGDDDSSNACCQWRYEEKEFNTACCKNPSYFNNTDTDRMFGEKCCKEAWNIPVPDPSAPAGTYAVSAHYLSSIGKCYSVIPMNKMLVEEVCRNDGSGFVCKNDYQGLAKNTCTNEGHNFPQPADVISIVNEGYHNAAWAAGDSASPGAGVTPDAFTGSYITSSGEHKREHIYNDFINSAVCTFSP